MALPGVVHHASYLMALKLFLSLIAPRQAKMAVKIEKLLSKHIAFI